MPAIINYINSFILIYFAAVWVIYLVFLGYTFRIIVRKYQEAEFNNVIAIFNQNKLIPLTIIMPAYNEAHRITKAINAIYNADYKNIHLIIVNDGSTDTTLSMLIEQYAMKKIAPSFQHKVVTGKVFGYYQSTRIPNMMVIDKEHSPFANSGSDCINAGLNACRTPLFLTIDSDTVIEPPALSYMLFMYLTHAHCIAVGGDIYVPDTSSGIRDNILRTSFPKNMVLGVQVCEYLRSFLYGREGWSLIGGVLCHPGAFTLLETQAVLEVGGFDAANFSYDAEIIMKLHHYMRNNKYPYSVVYAASAIGWAESPSTLKQFWKQRNYWQRGLLRSTFRHIKMLFNPRYGVTGLVAFPYFMILEVFGPLIEAVAYMTFIVAWVMGYTLFWQLFWYWLWAWGFMSLITIACIILNLVTYNKYPSKMDICRIFVVTSIDMLFFRQFKAFCSFFGSFHYLFNRLRGKAL